MKRRTGLFFVLAATALAADTLPGSETATLTGAFAQSGSPPALAGGQNLRGTIYGEWPGHAGNGRAVTGIFKSPENLELDVAGYPKLAGMRMLLEDGINLGQTLSLAVARDSGDMWVTRRWHLPKEWRNRRVRLVVEDQVSPGSNSAASAHRWIGFSAPRAYRPWNLGRFAYAAKTLVYLALEWIALILPGLAFAVWYSRVQVASAPRTISLMFAACGIAGIIGFFVFVLSVPLGRLYSGAVLLAALGLMLYFRRRIVPVMKGAVGAMLALWFVASVFYVSTALLYRNEDGIGEYVQDRFFEYQMPPDNLLPFILADEIYHHVQFRPTFFADIQSSDRPPLQSGLVLMQLGSYKDPPLQYLLLGILLQTTWIPALWVLLHGMNIRATPILAAIAVTGLSQFAYVHEMFVWPKLLSATFGLLALSCFGWLSDRRESMLEAALGGIFTALAMLSHGGVMMTVIGFAALTAIWHRPSWQWFIRFAIAAAAVYLPWILYQKFYDPPGDALFKLHLAGVIDRSHSLPWLIRTNYAQLGFSGWCHNKWSDIRLLFWFGGGLKMFGGDQKLLGYSELSFFSLFPGLGLANAGFLFLFLRPLPHAKAAIRLLLTSAASLVVWILIMFAPESTSIHQGSFVTVILLFSALTLLIAERSRLLAALLVVVQSIQFLVIAILAKPATGNSGSRVMDIVADPAMFVLFITSVVALSTWFWKTNGLPNDDNLS